MSSKLNAFVEEAKARGRMTINDHLVAAGITEYHAAKSMKAALTRALMPGGYWHDELGVTFVPSIQKAGRPSALADYCQAEPDGQATAPTPSKTLQSLQPVINLGGYKAEETVPSLVETRDVLIRAPRKTQEAVVVGMRQQYFENRFERERAETAERMLKQEREMREAADKRFDTLMALVQGLSTTLGAGTPAPATAQPPMPARQRG